MSWDIIIQDLPIDAQSVADIPNDYRPSQLGMRKELIARIQQILPEADFSDPSWGTLDHPEFSIEFSMGSAETCDSFALHVRGGGSAVATIKRLLDRLKRRAIDCQTGDFFSPQAAETSFGQWQAYRDNVINQRSSDGS